LYRGGVEVTSSGTKEGFPVGPGGGENTSQRGGGREEIRLYGTNRKKDFAWGEKKKLTGDTERGDLAMCQKGLVHVWTLRAKKKNRRRSACP